MDLASCHFPCIVPTVTTQRKSVLYFDVVTHQQPVFQEALHLGNSCYLQSVFVTLEEHLDLVVGDFNGAA